MITVKKLGKVLLMLVTFLLVYFDQAWMFFPPTESIDQMSIRLEKGLLSQAPYHLFWFGQQDQMIKLNYNVLLGVQPLSLYALTKQEAIVAAPLLQSRAAYRLDKDYSGSIVAVMPPVQLALGQDDRTEKIQLSAKIDTLFTQGRHPVRTTFADPRIPFEVCFKGYQGNQMLDVCLKGNPAIQLLFNAKPLRNQAVRLVSRRGYGLGVDQTLTTDAFGMLYVKDVRDLRTGISIIYRTADRIMYITNYRLEANSLFTKRYLKALAPLLKVFQWSILFILFLVTCQKLYRWQGRAIPLVKPKPAWMSRKELFGIFKHN
jgi:hypothetical protein